jgi:hypothetical protein
MSGVAKYRKRPVEVEAMQLTEANAAEVAEWCGGELMVKDGHWAVFVPTMHGEIPAQEGDYVIRGVVDFYPMPADQFAVSFDTADQVLGVVAAGVTRLAKEWGGRP